MSARGAGWPPGLVADEGDLLDGLAEERGGRDGWQDDAGQGVTLGRGDLEHPEAATAPLGAGLGDGQDLAERRRHGDVADLVDGADLAVEGDDQPVVAADEGELGKAQACEVVRPGSTRPGGGVGRAVRVPNASRSASVMAPAARC